MSPERQGVRWPRRAGAWLGIGTSPGALVLGAGLAARHAGELPWQGIVIGAALMAAMLSGQGLLGLVGPVGENGTLSTVAPRYLGARTLLLLNTLLAFAMVGWFGFNVGLGGSALAAVLGVAQPIGPLLLATPIVLVAITGELHRWNALAVVTTLASLALVVVVITQIAPPGSPVGSGAADPLDWISDAGVFVGYAAVFSLRAPDFSHGLRSRTDLHWCVGLLVVSTVGVATAGAALHRGTGTIDVVGAISGTSGSTTGNLLIALAVVAATFTTLHSGSLAIRAISPISSTSAIMAVALPGLVLAILRFDRHLLTWLGLLAALLPPLLVPIVVESTRRRRGREHRSVTLVSWLPGTIVACVLALAGSPVAALAGLAIAAVGTAVELRRPLVRRG